MSESGLYSDDSESNTEDFPDEDDDSYDYTGEEDSESDDENISDDYSDSDNAQIGETGLYQRRGSCSEHYYWEESQGRTQGEGGYGRRRGVTAFIIVFTLSIIFAIVVCYYSM